MSFNTDHKDAQLFELAVAALDENIAQIHDELLTKLSGTLEDNVTLLDKLTKLVESRKHIIDLAQQHLPPW